MSLSASGSSFFDKSDNATVDDSDLVLQSSSEDISWGIWQLPPGPNVLTGVSLLVAIAEGSAAWAAVSDYSTGQWEFHGPLADMEFIELDHATHVSPAGNFYVAVITGGGDLATVALASGRAYSPGWQTVTVDSVLHVGAFCSLAEVAGNPAIAYYAEDALDEGDLKYARSTTSTGASAADWSQFVLVDTEGSTGYDPSLAVIAGNPAIAYNDDSTDTLNYARASTATGAEPADWSTIVIVDDDGVVGLDPCLVIIDGNPAISHHQSIDAANGYLKYARSITSTGSLAEDWAQQVVVDNDGRVGWHSSMKEVDGSPAISYYDLTNDALKYARSSTAHGASAEEWTQIVTVDAGGVGNFSSLAVVAGNPAISYFDRSGDDLKYARSTTASGGDAADWSQVLTIHAAGETGEYTSLSIVDGNPAVAYYDAGLGSLLYRRSTGPTGGDAGEWLAVPEIVDNDGTVGRWASLAVIGGRPAIAYYDSTSYDLKYAVLVE